MKKKIFVIAIVLVIALAATASVGAQVRLDIDINDPIYAGFVVNGVQQGAWNSYPYIPIPDAKLMYQFSLGPVNLGAGVRVFTLIIENFLYPEITAELNLNPFVVDVSVGGFGFLMFGLLSDALAGTGVEGLNGFHSVVLPDISVGYKVNETFRISVGALAIAPFDSTLGGVLANNVFAGYVKATFVVMFK